MSAEVYTIVAFRYNQKRSVLYKNTINIKVLQQHLKQAIEERGADVISIRRVKLEQA